MKTPSLETILSYAYDYAKNHATTCEHPQAYREWMQRAVQIFDLREQAKRGTIELAPKKVFRPASMADRSVPSVSSVNSVLIRKPTSKRQASK